MMKTTVLLLFFATVAWGKIVVYEGTGTDCDTLLYTESFGLIVGESDLIDLTEITATASCSKTANDGRQMAISFGDVSDTLKTLELAIDFSATTTGYWNSKVTTLSYNNGTADVKLTGEFPPVSMVSTIFSFACSLHSVTALTMTGGTQKAVATLNMYQIQVYNVSGSTFSSSYQCVNWISKGAWMGVFTGLIMISVLVMSVMMLLGTSTPDRFETTKSKCLLIPHEH